MNCAQCGEELKFKNEQDKERFIKENEDALGVICKKCGDKLFEKFRKTKLH